MTETARLCLTTPERFEPESLALVLARLLDTGLVASVRIALAEADEAAWIHAANHLMPVAHGADVPCLVTDRPELVGRLGLDGVHLAARTSSLGALRKSLGREAILGAEAGTSRHLAMSLAEAGADYVAVGPAGAEAADLLAWWSEMIETPSLVEGGLSPEAAAPLAAMADFVAPDLALWKAEDPAAHLALYAAALGD
ncbi:MAG: thiamine phosphate synthase [Pseudomonadota bacterium]